MRIGALLHNELKALCDQCDRSYQIIDEQVDYSDESIQRFAAFSQATDRVFRGDFCEKGVEVTFRDHLEARVFYADDPVKEFESFAKAMFGNVGAVYVLFALNALDFSDREFSINDLSIYVAKQLDLDEEERQRIRGLMHTITSRFSSRNLEKSDHDSRILIPTKKGHYQSGDRAIMVPLSGLGASMVTAYQDALVQRAALGID